MSSPDKEQFVVSLARGLAVLRSFRRDVPEMTLSEVASATGLSPAVARRFLLTLVSLGYLAQVGKRFVLTPRVMELSASYLESMNLAEVVQPHLQRIRDSTGDSVSLTVLDGLEIIHLCHVQTQRLLRFAVASGSRVPAYVSATGRAILAFEPEARLAEFLAAVTFEPRTPRTVAGPEQLRAELDRVRRDGFSVVVDELDFGIMVVGCPVIFNGAPVAGLSCAAASGYLPVEEFVASRVPLLTAAASTLCAELERLPALVHSLNLR